MPPPGAWVGFSSPTLALPIPWPLATALGSELHLSARSESGPATRDLPQLQDDVHQKLDFLLGIGCPLEALPHCKAQPCPLTGVPLSVPKAPTTLHGPHPPYG